MKSMKIWLLCSVLVFIVITPANGFSDPAQVKLLTQQLVVLKENLDEAREQVKEIKIVNDEVLEMRNTIDDLYKEYESLADTDLQSDLEYIANKYRALTNLDDLKDAETLKEKYALLHEEIAMRFKHSERRDGDQPLPVEAQMQRTVVDLNFADEQSLYYQKKLEDLSRGAVSSKDVEKINAQAQVTNALLALEEKKKELEKKRAAQADMVRDINWNEQFISYITNREMNDTKLQDTVISRLIVNTLNPKSIYEGMAKFSGIGALFLWFLVAFMGFRLLKEAFASLGKGGSMINAIQETNQSLFGYVVYATAGFGIFALIFAFLELFDSSTSVSYIHSHLLELRQNIVVNNKTYDSWLEKALEYVVDSTNVLNNSLVWVVYQAISMIYVFLSQFIDVVFAIGVAFCWLFGFVAIATRALPESFQTVNGWLSSVYGLFMWGVIELILMSILSLISYGGSTWIESNYGDFGSGFTGLLVWHVYACIMMVVILVLKIAAIFFAFMLSRNQSILSVLGAMPAALGAIALNKALPNNNTNQPNEEGGLLNSMRPDAAGDRRRDGLARGGEALSSAMNAPISDVVRATTSGLSNLTSSVSSMFSSETPSSSFGSNTSHAENGPAGGSETGTDQVDTGASSSASTPGAEASGSSPGHEEPASNRNQASSSSQNNDPRFSSDGPPVPTEYEEYASMMSQEDNPA